MVCDYLIQKGGSNFIPFKFPDNFYIIIGNQKGGGSSGSVSGSTINSDISEEIEKESDSPDAFDNFHDILFFSHITVHLTDGQQIIFSHDKFVNKGSFGQVYQYKNTINETFVLKIFVKEDEDNSVLSNFYIKQKSETKIKEKDIIPQIKKSWKISEKNEKNEIVFNENNGIFKLDGFVNSYYFKVDDKFFSIMEQFEGSLGILNKINKEIKEYESLKSKEHESLKSKEVEQGQEQKQQLPSEKSETSEKQKRQAILKGVNERMKQKTEFTNLQKIEDENIRKLYEMKQKFNNKNMIIEFIKLFNTLYKLWNCGYYYTDIKLENILYYFDGQNFFLSFGDLDGIGNRYKDYKTIATFYNPLVLTNFTLSMKKDHEISLLWQFGIMLLKIHDPKNSLIPDNGNVKMTIDEILRIEEKTENSYLKMLALKTLSFNKQIFEKFSQLKDTTLFGGSFESSGHIMSNDELQREIDSINERLKENKDNVMRHKETPSYKISEEYIDQANRFEDLWILFNKKDLISNLTNLKNNLNDVYKLEDIMKTINDTRRYDMVECQEIR